MSRTWAGPATHRQEPHRYEENHDEPGTCRHGWPKACRLIKRNEVHDEQKAAAVEARQRAVAEQAAAVDRRVLGETEGMS
jgi:hypothetical protein